MSGPGPGGVGSGGGVNPLELIERAKKTPVTTSDQNAITNADTKNKVASGSSMNASPSKVLDDLVKKVTTVTSDLKDAIIDIAQKITDSQDNKAPEIVTQDPVEDTNKKSSGSNLNVNPADARKKQEELQQPQALKPNSDQLVQALSEQQSKQKPETQTV